MKATSRQNKEASLHEPTGSDEVRTTAVSRSASSKSAPCRTVEGGPANTDLPERNSLFEIAPERLPISRADFGIALLLALGAALFHLPMIGVMEFFRHTEADRLLIAWEMVRTGDYLIPHLLGSVLLTKPPLFYWLVAVAIQLTGSTAEWVARLPSSLIAISFVSLQFLLLRRIGVPRNGAVLSAACLGTGALFGNLAIAGEIDMLFGFLCAISFYLLYIGMAERSGKYLAGAYAVIGVAMLTKGAAALLLMCCVHGLFALVKAWLTDGIPSLLREAGRMMVGAVVASIICCFWLVPAAIQIGTAPLIGQVEVELIDRIVSHIGHQRNILFYFKSFPVVIAPWSIFLIAGGYVLWRDRKGNLAEYLGVSPQLVGFILFNLCIVLFSLVAFSLAQGKASRYMLPSYAAAINLCVVGMAALRGTRVTDLLLRFGIVVGLIGCVGMTIYSLVGDIRDVTPFGLVSSVVLISISCFVLVFTCYRRRAFHALLALFLVAGAARWTEKYVYGPHRNSTRSVKGIAAEINAAIPPGEPLYNIELFERWVTYYIARAGRWSYRLSPANIDAVVASQERAYLLLNDEEERWRYDQLRKVAPDTKLVLTVDSGQERFLLIEAPTSALTSLHLHARFPTTPSPPES